MCGGQWINCIKS